MSLTLSAAAQRRLADAIRVLASPLASTSEAEWRALAAEHARDAVGTGTGVLTMVTDHGLEAGMAGVDPCRVEDYRRFLPLLEQHGVLARGLRLGAGTRREIYGPAYEVLARTDYTRDFLPSIRSYDGFSFIAPLVPHPRTFADMVQLTLSVTERGRSISERQCGLGRLLYPAFAAGLRTLTSMRRARSRFRATLDSTGVACFVTDRTGRRVHCTPSLSALCTREPQRAALLALAARVACSFWTDAPMPRASFAGQAAAYMLSATEVHDGRDAYCVVAVSASDRRSPRHALGAAPLAPEARADLGLTPRQAEVALLLAGRRTNREIADALNISVHTARHHVEAALERLGVARGAVAAVLRVATSGAHGDQP